MVATVIRAQIEGKGRYYPSPTGARAAVWATRPPKGKCLRGDLGRPSGGCRPQHP